MVSKGFLSVGCIVLALYYVQCSSEINLSVSPAIIDVNLTHTMTMNCSMKHAIVSHLVSIVITRLDANDREEIVASVSTFDRALPATDQQNMVVNGSVLEPKVTDNYLLLTWDHPNAHQSSNYTCEINAIDAHSRPVRYSQWMNVPSRVPTTEDIVIMFVFWRSRLKSSRKRSHS